MPFSKGEQAMVWGSIVFGGRTLLPAAVLSELRTKEGHHPSDLRAHDLPGGTPRDGLAPTTE